MNLKNMIKFASFTPDLLQSPSAFLGHLPFSAWVIQESLPKIFVELGTHYGHSYFAFCQSILEANTSTKCFAVDTWQGDEHSQIYGEDVFDKVNSYHQEHYSGFSRLLKMTFDDAVSYFSDKSIDLLHIDGFHTYEAVRHDFETWLPKLSPHAIIMLHDTNVRERNFGVWKFWEELQRQYPNNIEFLHSYGLGVLQLGNCPEDKKHEWLKCDSTEKQTLIDYFSALGLRQVERFELNELKKNVSLLNQTISERESKIATLSQAISEGESKIATLNQAISEYDKQVSSLIASKSRQSPSLLNRFYSVLKKKFR